MQSTSITMQSTGIEYSIKPTNQAYNITYSHKLLLKNLTKRVCDESTNAEAKILEMAFFLGIQTLSDAEPIIGTLYKCDEKTNKFEYFSRLKSEGKLKCYHPGEALRLVNELLSTSKVQESNNEHFMVFVETQTGELAWFGIHRGNSRNYRFWFVKPSDFKDMAERASGIGNYFIS